MLTLRTLLEEMGLAPAVGDESADAPVRWVHITELPDPTPWLSGGELILTTGLQLTTAELQRDFVRRLADHQLAGLGFGVGFEHDQIPAPLATEASAQGFPVFEVPYDLPFIAITEKAFARLVNEQYGVLQRGTAIHKRLERLVIEERGLDELVRALAAALGGTVTVLDAHGDTLAHRTFRRELAEGVLDTVLAEVRTEQAAHEAGQADTTELSPQHAAVAGRSVVLPVYTRGRGAPRAWLFATRDSGGLGDFERLILQQATTVVALELMRQRAMHDTERRLAGDVLAEALTGRLAERELASRLRPFGVGERAAVLVFAARDPVGEASELDRFLHDGGHGALVAPRESLLCAVVDAGDEALDPVELAREARSVLGSGGGPPRAAASRREAVGALRRSFNEARCALEAAALANGAAPEVASYRDMGAAQLLLNLQDDEALALYCQSVLGPLEDDGGEYGQELIRSLEAFIEHNGQWEKAARQTVLPPAHAALPHPQGRGADRARPEQRARPDRAVAGPAGTGAGARMSGDPRPAAVRPLRVAVLGAGGTIAPAIVRDLAESEEVERLLLLDINEARARATGQAHAPDAEVAQVDREGGLGYLLSGVDVLVNSASYRANLHAMRACLEADCHYIDLGGLYHLTTRQMELNDDFTAVGRLALLGMGSSPGKTNVMGARAVLELGATPEQMDVYAAGRDLDPPDGASYPYAPRTLVDELTEPPMVLRGGQPVALEPMQDGGAYPFPEPIGSGESIYTLHSEVRTFGDSFGCSDCSFRLSLAPAVLERVKDLVGADEDAIADAAATVVPGSARTVSVHVVTAGAGDRLVTITAKTEGMVEWGIGGGMVSTAAPAAAAVRLLARRQIDAVGAMPPERCVSPDDLFPELERRNCSFEVATTEEAEQR